MFSTSNFTRRTGLPIRGAPFLGLVNRTRVGTLNDEAMTAPTSAVDGTAQDPGGDSAGSSVELAGPARPEEFAGPGVEPELPAFPEPDADGCENHQIANDTRMPTMVPTEPIMVQVCVETRLARGLGGCPGPR